MASKPRNLFLYLTIACFIAIIAIFVFDGYLGVYDTLYITTGELEQRVEPDFWLHKDAVWSTWVSWDDKAFFRYQLDNRQFSSYSAEPKVSLWRSQEKIRDLLSQSILIAPFANKQVEWIVDTAQLKSAGFSPEQSYQVTVVINRGEVERRIILSINPSPYPPKAPRPVPAG